MFGLGGSHSSGAKALLRALDQSLATIEFDLQGTILAANKNFCAAVGYDLSEIRGKHHSIFVNPAYAQSSEYRAFWAKLGRGEHDQQEYRRVGKGGRDVWLQASYNPIRNVKGAVIGVVKQATDITAEKLKGAALNAQIKAIDRAQAVIEFTVQGEVVTANENFLNALGYRLEEIRGKHHRLFVEPAQAQSPDYEAFWNNLRAGSYVAGEFKRVGKGGREVWIQATYNPVFDFDGKVVKVVKFATDVTARVKAVNAIASGLIAIADNNLNFRIDDVFDPSFDQLRLNFNGSMTTIEGSLLGISHRTGAIQSGTREILTAAEDLSRRTEQQASSLEETASALDKITATVRKTAEGSRHTRGVVSAAKKSAEASGLVVSQAVEAMNRIEASSREIGQIIGAIDEIAFQTNLLALNAGVEAARAGDAGRGFAVVASEVRALAQRSADAAKEIKRLVSTSGQQVDHGVALVGQAGEALTLIVSQVAEIDLIVGEIASSAQEQATALDEVNTAVNQMDQVTQQNATMVEETTAASQALEQETAELSRLVGQFSLAEGNPAASPARRAAQHPARLPAAEPVKALRTVGRGGAARKPDVTAAQESWEEF